MTERATRVDVAILGAGSAGLSARRAAKAAGARVAMVDPGPFGTTCARVGCMPSKLLIAAADAAHAVRGARAFGVHAEGLRVDGPAVLSRVQRERDRFMGFALRTLDEARAAGELIEGRGRVTGPGVLHVEGHGELGFGKLVIATGTAAITPAPFRALGDALLTNENVFELSDLPASLLVVGLGVIGLELGQALARLGVRTTLVGVDGMLGPLSDPEVLAEAKRVLSESLDLHPDYTLKSVTRAQDGVHIAFVDSRGAVRDEVFERVLIAAGRRPNLRDLGLETLGAQADERGEYPIDADTLQLADLPVFVAGDVNGLHPLLHEATDDGRIAGENAVRYPDLHEPPRRTPLTIVFSHPQMGLVGQSYQQLAECHAVVGEVRFADQGRARVMDVAEGLVRIYAEQHSGRLLGAELFGPRVEHLSHLLAWAVQQGLTAKQALGMPYYHPVLEEGLRTALRDLDANLRQGDPIKCRVSELGVGS